MVIAVKHYGETYQSFFRSFHFSLISLLCPIDFFRDCKRKTSRPVVFCKKSVLRNFTNFTGKNLCQSLFFNEVAGRPAISLRKRLWHRFFPVNLVKFLRKPFLQNTTGRLLPSAVF